MVGFRKVTFESMSTELIFRLVGQGVRVDSPAQPAEAFLDSLSPPLVK